MLDERKSQLLEFIVREYIKRAEPVGSSLAVQKGFDVSSATIRNEMQDLELSGYLMQPHTSAGRVPTDKAYRWYVDQILASGDYQLDPKYIKKIQLALSEAGRDPREINKKLAQILSELTDNLVIANISQSEEFHKFGLSSLFESPEFRQFERMFQLTSFFDHFDQLFDQIEREFFRHIHHRTGFSIFIGRENPLIDIKGETTMHARYMLPDEYTGTITIIGPMRMDYKKNIGLVAYITQLMNQLNQ